MFRCQGYSSVEKFARQEAAKAAMNHMRWGLQAQVPAASCTLLCAHPLLKPFAPTPPLLISKAWKVY
ncbi:MAG: hypothetical protein ACPIOQ_10505 [Promethearchaeia archaeon]